MRFPTIIFTISLMTTSAAAHNHVHISQMSIVEAGIYYSETVHRSDVLGTTGTINTVRNPIILQRTTSIPAQKGIRFGVRYVLAGHPVGSSVELVMSTLFPAGGLHNPSTAHTIVRNTYSVMRIIGEAAYREYYLEHDWELATGVWTFEFWHHGRKLGQQPFCIYGPRTESRAPYQRHSDRCLDLLSGADLRFDGAAAGGRPTWTP